MRAPMLDIVTHLDYADYSIPVTIYLRWLQDVRKNIETHFAAERPSAIDELYVSCENQIMAVVRGLYSVYSIIASPC